MKPLRRLLSVVVLGGALAVLSTAVGTQQPVPGQPDLKVGDVAPDFTLQASDGQTYSLAKLKGKFVVLAWFPKAFTAG
jgi:cytochrome oxidase Cu insertion factor (SCO1/SenC/PrrC family)